MTSIHLPFTRADGSKVSVGIIMQPNLDKEGRLNGHTYKFYDCDEETGNATEIGHMVTSFGKDQHFNPPHYDVSPDFLKYREYVFINDVKNETFESGPRKIKNIGETALGLAIAESLTFGMEGHVSLDASWQSPPFYFSQGFEPNRFLDFRFQEEYEIYKALKEGKPLTAEQEEEFAYQKKSAQKRLKTENPSLEQICANNVTESMREDLEEARAEKRHVMWRPSQGSINMHLTEKARDTIWKGKIAKMGIEPLVKAMAAEKR